MPLLEIKNLFFQVGTATILEDLRLSVDAAEGHALLGTNDTGKNTLAYLVVECEGYRPTTGAIFFDGQPIHTSKIHKKAQLGITMAWQEPVRFKGISVAQYLTLNNCDLDPASFLNMVGLEPLSYLQRMVDRSLSGVERKRIELASILALRPRLAIDYAVQAEENGVVELTARIFGHGHDLIVIKEKVMLAGENSRGLIKTRVPIEDEDSAKITGITEGNAAAARGYVDCLEIIKDNAVASAIPIVRVTHPLAKVTHEAAIGSVDKRQLETFMAQGLSPEEVVDVIVKGILR